MQAAYLVKLSQCPWYDWRKTFLGMAKLPYTFVYLKGRLSFIHTRFHPHSKAISFTLWPENHKKYLDLKTHKHPIIVLKTHIFISQSNRLKPLYLPSFQCLRCFWAAPREEKKRKSRRSSSKSRRVVVRGVRWLKG